MMEVMASHESASVVVAVTVVVTVVAMNEQ